jgi:phosphoribosylformimino-5-aminoimidazole carboxamide ribotide isomerase
MLVIPAIDILDGKCVRLHQGDFRQKTVYSDHPADMAKRFVDAGFPLLHVVDLDGAKEGRLVNWDTIESVAKVPGVRLEVGGGVRSSDHIRQILDVGANRVVVGSVAAKSPDLASYWIEQFGPDRIVIGMDVKNSSIAISGWLEDSHLQPTDFLFDMVSRKARTFIATDISRDGTMEGTNLEFFAAVRRAFPSIELYASGGISALSDIVALKRSGVAGVIVGKALYEGRLKLEDLLGAFRI